MALIFRDKGTSGTQIEVLSGDLRIAHIGKEVLSIVASHAVRWRWSFAIMVGPPGFQPHGHADTFADQKRRPSSMPASRWTRRSQLGFIRAVE